MRIKIFSLTLFLLFSCSKTSFNLENKGYNFDKWEKESKAMKVIIKDGESSVEDDKEIPSQQFTDILGKIDNPDSCYHLFIDNKYALFEQGKSCYLEKFSDKIREIESQNPEITVRIFDSFKWNRMNILAKKNHEKHIQILLKFYKEGHQLDKDDEKQTRYDNLIYKLLKAYILSSEPDKDKKVKKDDFISETIEQCSDEDKAKKIDNLANFLTNHKDSLEKIWNKKYMGDIINFSIKNHKFNATELILKHEYSGGKEKIGDILNNPLTELIQYYSDKGEKREYLGYKRTSNPKEVVEIFTKFIRLGAKLENEYKNGKVLFLNMLDFLKLGEVKMLLEVLYEEEEVLRASIEKNSKGNDEEIKNTKANINYLYKLIKGEDKFTTNDVRTYVRIKKASTSDEYYDRVIKLIEGDKSEWGEKKIGKYLREKGPYKTVKKVYTVQDLIDMGIDIDLGE